MSLKGVKEYKKEVEGNNFLKKNSKQNLKQSLKQSLKQNSKQNLKQK